MREEIITFKTAKLAKEKGFSYYVSYSYWNEELTSMTPGYALDDGTHSDYKIYLEYQRYLAPTQSLLQKWLREEHNVWVMPEYNGAGIMVYIHNKGKIDSGGIGLFQTYEQALEKGLQEALKLI